MILEALDHYELLKIQVLDGYVAFVKQVDGRVHPLSVGTVQSTYPELD